MNIIKEGVLFQSLKLCIEKVCYEFGKIDLEWLKQRYGLLKFLDLIEKEINIGIQVKKRVKGKNYIVIFFVSYDFIQKVME